MHVVVLFQHYHTPDCATAARPFSLVNRLAETCNVTLITSNAFRNCRLAYDFDWVPEGVNLVELDIPYENAMSASQRIYTYLSYLLRSVYSGLFVEPPDLIFGSSTPLTVACAASALAKRFRVPWIFEVRDLWPDFPIQMGALPKGLPAHIARRIERGLYDSAAHVIASSPDMARHVDRLSTTPVTSVPYGTDFQLLADAKQDIPSFIEKHDVQNDYLVTYTGTFGRANAIPTLIEMMQMLASRTDVTFAVAGNGFFRDELRQLSIIQQNVKLLPPLPYKGALTLLSASTLSLVPFNDLPVLDTNAPSKLFDSLSAGTPVVVTNSGWTTTLVRTHDCGWVTRPEDAASLAATVSTALDTTEDLQRKSENSRETGARLFRREEHMDRIARIINDVAANIR